MPAMTGTDGNAARPRLPCCSIRCPVPETFATSRNYRVREGETLLVLVPHNHRYWLERNGRWEFFWISMNGEEAMQIHKAILATTGPVLKLKPDTIEHLADCTRRLIFGGAEAPGSASAIAYEAAMALYDDVFGSHPVFSQEYRTMQHVIDHIVANLDKPLPVEDMAKISGLSRAHFSASSPQAKACRRPNSFCEKKIAEGDQAFDQDGPPVGQGSFQHGRLRGPELLRQGVPPLLWRKSDGVPHHRHVFQHFCGKPEWHGGRSFRPGRLTTSEWGRILEVLKTDMDVLCKRALLNVSETALSFILTLHNVLRSASCRRTTTVEDENLRHARFTLSSKALEPGCE